MPPLGTCADLIRNAFLPSSTSPLSSSPRPPPPPHPQSHSIKGTTATVEFNCESRTQTHIQFMGSVINSKGQNINHNLCMWVYLWPHNIMPLNVPEIQNRINPFPCNKLPCLSCVYYFYILKFIAIVLELQSHTINRAREGGAQNE